MIKITPRNLHTALQEQLETGNFVALLDALVHFIRKGGSRHAAERFDMLLELLTENPELAIHSVPVFTSGSQKSTFTPH